VNWPCGSKELFANVAANQHTVLKQGEGSSSFTDYEYAFPDIKRSGLAFCCQLSYDVVMACSGSLA